MIPVIKRPRPRKRNRKRRDDLRSMENQQLHKIAQLMEEQPDLSRDEIVQQVKNEIPCKDIEKKNNVKLKRRELPRGETYRERDVILKFMGFDSYESYRRSETWKRINARKRRKFPKCEVCESKTEVVHHISYCRSCLLGCRDWLLVCLCHKCHAEIEIDAEGNKRSLKKANKTLRKLMRENNGWLNHLKPKIRKQILSGKKRNQKNPKKRYNLMRRSAITNCQGQQAQRQNGEWDVKPCTSGR